MPRRTAWMLAIAKLSVSVALIVYLVSGIDGKVFADLASSLHGHLAILVIVLFFAVFILSGVRWRGLSSIAGSPISFSEAFGLTMIGQCFNQVLPTSIGGDAARAWYAQNAKMDLTHAAAAVLCDRIIGLCGLALLIVLLFPASWQFSEDSVRIQVLVIAAGCLLGTAAFAASSSLFADDKFRLLKSSAGLLSHILRVRTAAGWLLGATLLAHVITGLIGYVLIAYFSPGAPVLQSIALFLAALLVSMVPVSYAGWGLREATVVFFLRDAGVSPDAAFKASVTYGVLLAVASLPGILFWAARTSPNMSGR